MGRKNKMEERSLRITGTSTNFFNKLTNTLTKILIPTKNKHKWNVNKYEKK